MSLQFANLARVLLLALVAGGASAQQEPAESCGSCHDQKIKGVHQPLGCATCHDNHEKYPHPKNAPKPACASCHEDIARQDQRGVHGKERASGNQGAPECSTCHGGAHEVARTKAQDFRVQMPDTCGMCHEEQAKQFKDSVHGKAVADGIGEAPVCTDCHGVHSILPHTAAASPVNALQIRETCASCHGDVRLARKFGLPSDRLLSFDASFHGLASKSGSQTVANCASCHGFHHILASSDPRSTTHTSKLAATCGKCHPGAGQRFALGPIHNWEGKGESEYVALVRNTYYVLIPLVLGLMFLHNAGDWVQKVWRMRIRRISAPVVALAGSVRMLPFERFQHALLVLSFFALVWTGFALKYPDQWWARPLLTWEHTLSVRSVIHRIAAVIFTIVSITHLISLIVSKSLRDHWKHMLPRRNDIREAWRCFAFNLGLTVKPATRSAHSYVEKAEYWAVVWGAIVMAGSGLMLWANNYFLRVLPKWALDVATAVHFYEAVLATAAIVVWHFYFVIFDPDVYPMDLGWLTGRSVRKQEEPLPVAKAGD